jgi:ABC-type sugar transport system permease subunit
MLNPESGCDHLACMETMDLVGLHRGLPIEWWAKIAILIVNLWLSYPYFMLICSGALQSIPEDIYAAAQVDGASALAAV